MNTQTTLSFTAPTVPIRTDRTATLAGHGPGVPELSQGPVASSRNGGVCPACGGELVDYLVYVGGKGYDGVTECTADGCEFRRVN